MASISKREPTPAAEGMGFGEKQRKGTGNRTALVRRFFTAVVVLLVLLIILAVIIWVIFLPGKEAKDAKCSNVCQKLEYLQPHPPLIIISLDGYAYKYLSRKIQPTLDRVAECGVKAKVYPSFPSQTFPNHITIATGLYPGHHGIVANMIYDLNVSSKPEYLGKTLIDDHYKKEPIWSLYQRETKRRAAVIAWIGSSHNSTYYLQPHYHVPFSLNEHPDKKLDQAIKWLKLSKDERPGLIMIYVTEPDNHGHAFSDRKEKVNDVIKSLDKALNTFLHSLKDEQLLGCVNIVILSDHGMARIKNRVVLEELFDINDLIISSGANSLIFRNNTVLSDEQIMSALTCKETDYVRVFKKTTIPPRFHYAESRRIGDYIVLGQRDAYIYSRRKEIWDPHTGDHGFDYILPDMHTIMFARGPSFKKNMELPPFINVEYMNLWTELLQLSAHNNDGEPGFMDMALITGGGPLKKHHKSVRSCKMTDALINHSLNIICGECSKQDEDIFTDWTKCIVNGVSNAIEVLSDNGRFCHMKGCNDMAILDDRNDFAYLATLIEEYHMNSNEKLLSENCTFHLANLTSPCQRTKINETVEYKALSAFPGRVISNDFSLITPWKTRFIREVFDPLNSYTQKIAKKLGRLVSITGTAYDDDYNGIHSSTPSDSPYPTHLFRILIACDGHWSSDGSYCLVPQQTKALSFIFPHMNGDPNCLNENELLLQYTARIKDVENISGQYFNFTNMPNKQQVLLKTYINVELW